MITEAIVSQYAGRQSDSQLLKDLSSLGLPSLQPEQEQVARAELIRALTEGVNNLMKQRASEFERTQLQALLDLTKRILCDVWNSAQDIAPGYFSCLTNEQLLSLHGAVFKDSSSRGSENGQSGSDKTEIALTELLQGGYEDKLELQKKQGVQLISIILEEIEKNPAFLLRDDSALKRVMIVLHLSVDEFKEQPNRDENDQSYPNAPVPDVISSVFACEWVVERAVPEELCARVRGKYPRKLSQFKLPEWLKADRSSQGPFLTQDGSISLAELTKSLGADELTWLCQHGIRSRNFFVRCLSSVLLAGHTQSQVVAEFIAEGLKSTSDTMRIEALILLAKSKPDQVLEVEQYFNEMLERLSSERGHRSGIRNPDELAIDMIRLFKAFLAAHQREAVEWMASTVDQAVKLGNWPLITPEVTSMLIKVGAEDLLRARTEAFKQLIAEETAEHDTDYIKQLQHTLYLGEWSPRSRWQRILDQALDHIRSIGGGGIEDPNLGALCKSILPYERRVPVHTLLSSTDIADQIFIHKEILLREGQGRHMDEYDESLDFMSTYYRENPNCPQVANFIKFLKERIRDESLKEEVLDPTKVLFNIAPTDKDLPSFLFQMLVGGDVKAFIPKVSENSLKQQALQMLCRVDISNLTAEQKGQLKAAWSSTWQLDKVDQLGFALMLLRSSDPALNRLPIESWVTNNHEGARCLIFAGFFGGNYWDTFERNADNDALRRFFNLCKVNPEYTPALFPGKNNVSNVEQTRNARFLSDPRAYLDQEKRARENGPGVSSSPLTSDKTAIENFFEAFCSYFGQVSHRDLIGSLLRLEKQEIEKRYPEGTSPGDFWLEPDDFWRRTLS